MPVPYDLLARWAQRRDEWRKLRVAVDGATICEEVLEDLDALQRAEGEAVLKLADAAMVSGYSLDHLARLLRDGKLPNVGRKGAPRIRLTDLPKRPQATLAGRGPKSYDPGTDARSLRSRLGER
jgi:hypothetical protein